MEFNYFGCLQRASFLLHRRRARVVLFYYNHGIRICGEQKCMRRSCSGIRVNGSRNYNFEGLLKNAIFFLGKISRKRREQKPQVPLE